MAAKMVMERNYREGPAMEHGGETLQCGGGVERGEGGAGARWR
jgi:hypothetical protein